jgi:hypothetical protein
MIQVNATLLLKRTHFTEQVCIVVMLHTHIEEAVSLDINFWNVSQKFYHFNQLASYNKTAYRAVVWKTVGELQLQK